MSNKSAKEHKPVELPPVPRPLDQIQTEYAQLCQRAGEAQYRKFLEEQNLERLNRDLVAVNNEGAARKQLDAEAAQKAKESSNE